MKNFETIKKDFEILFEKIPKHYSDDGVETILLRLPIDGWYKISYEWGWEEDFVIEHCGFEEKLGDVKSSDDAEFIDKGSYVSKDHVNYISNL